MSNDIGTRPGPRGHLAGIAMAAAVLALTSVAAQPADDIKAPTGYRNWFHVNTMIVDKASPLFDTLGGMHNVHVNSVGEAALRRAALIPTELCS